MAQINQPPGGKLIERANLKTNEKVVQEKVSKVKKGKLLAYENKPSCCGQLWDLLTMHKRNLCGTSCCAIVCLVIVPIFCFLTFALIGVTTKAKTYPEFTLEKLKHPLYSTSYYHPEHDKFDADFSTAQDQ